MKIYKVTQDAVYGYDTYDSFVVVAPNEEEARNIHLGVMFGMMVVGVY